jgi:hypothetical protein
VRVVCAAGWAVAPMAERVIIIIANRCFIAGSFTG